MGQTLFIQKLPGGLGVTFSAAFSSLPIFDEGRRPITNPIENISKKKKPQISKEN